MLFCHLCQHIVCRPIDNPHHLCDAICREALLQRLDDRNSTANTRLIEKINTIFICCRIELRQILRNHIFVCCNNMFPRSHRTQHIVLCWMDAPHHLYDNRNFLIVDDCIEIICQRNSRKFGTIFFSITYKNRFNLNLCPSTRHNLLCIHGECTHNPTANGSCTQQGNLYRLIHSVPALLVSPYNVKK